jgi:hypothetical protein
VSGERWDVVLRALEGPRAREGEFVARGPVIRLGAKPGSGGVALEGYRGLDDRQAVITVYEDGRATIQAVGNSQVRLAPHEHVDWAEVLNLTGPAYLTDGAAVHLGPNGRGCTLIFVTCQPLGAWEAGKIKSRVAVGGVVGIAHTDVVELQTGSGRPMWFLPAVTFIAFAAVAVVTVQLLVEPEIPPLGPERTVREVYEVADLEAYAIDINLQEGLNQAFHDFVMQPNVRASGRDELLQPESWDPVLLDYVNISVQQHAQDYRFWMRLDTIRDEYAFVVETMREEDLPEVFAGIPYTESRYDSLATSPVCAAGHWQFMPEVGHRAGLVIRDCAMSGSNSKYTPTRIALMPNPLTAEYVVTLAPDDPTGKSSYACRLKKCVEDERRELEKSTIAAAGLLAEAFLDDDELRASGAAVQMTIASHNCGYNDGPHGRPSAYNVLPAFQRWKHAEPTAEQAHFVGKQILCTDNSYANHDTCGSFLPRETQHYTYPIIASHFLAVCYYASNYSKEYNAFNEWERYLNEDAYCSKLNIPTAQELREKSG